MAKSNGVEFTDNSIEIKADLNKALVAFLYEASGAVAGQAAKFSPVGESGQLRKSWKRVVDKGQLKATIGSPLEYAIYQEFGTGEYALEGNGRKGYWVYVKDNTSGNMAKSSRQYTLEEAQSTVAYLREEKGLDAYYTKGTRPKRMLYRSFKMYKPKIEARARQVFKQKGF